MNHKMCETSDFADFTPNEVFGLQKIDQLNSPYKGEPMSASLLVNTTRAPMATVIRKADSQIRNRTDRHLIDEEYTPSADNYPYVSCKSFVVIDADRNKTLQQKNADQIREMASLTKIMTALVSI